MLCVKMFNRKNRILCVYKIIDQLMCFEQILILKKINVLKKSKRINLFK